MKKFAANNGFTLIELMITLVVVIILVAIAAPSFNSMIRDSRAATQANNLLSSLQIARSEAINRGVQVSIRRLGDTPSSWVEGWRIFTDWDGNGEIPPANLDIKDCSVDDQDCLLMEQEAVGNNLSIVTGGNYTTWLGFLPSGAIVSSGLANDTFKISTPGTDTRCLKVNNVGRPRIYIVAEGAVC